MPKSWYSVKNVSADSLDVEIHEEIGLWGISAKEFIADIKDKNYQTINLTIHSPGGNLFDGLAMYHALKNHPATVNATVLAMAGSAASVVLMAADNIAMPVDSYVFIHDPSLVAGGNSSDLREAADLLDRFGENIINIYERRTGMARDELKAMMAREEFIAAADAVEMGFADELVDAVKVAANAAGFARRLKNMPTSISGKNTIDNSNPDDIQTIQDLEKFLREVGNFSNSLATATVGKAKKLLQSESASDLTAIDALNKFKLTI